MLYDAVIFDLDGTLTDSEKGIVTCVEYALHKMGRPVPPLNTLRRFLGPPLAQSFMRYCDMDQEQAWQATLLYRERYIPVGWKENRVYPGVRRMLRALKDRGAYLAVATGKPQKTSEKVLEYFGLLPYFDAVAGPSDKDAHADKKQLIERVLPKGKTAVMVGDTAPDILGARQAGIDGVAALYGYGDHGELMAANPVAAVESGEALADLLCPGGSPRRGLFITLEGVDGCGKSTQQNAVFERLTEMGYDVMKTREPGGCPIAEAIRGIVLAKEDGGMCAETEALLFAAARAQHVRQVILPAVESGKTVLCDRFVDSSLVYQGAARGLGMDWVRQINRAAMTAGAPDWTIYLQMSHQAALNRRMKDSAPDRIERQDEDFFARAHAAYDRLAAEEGRFLTVDGAKEQAQVTEDILALLLPRMMEALG